MVRIMNINKILFVSFLSIAAGFQSSSGSNAPRFKMSLSGKSDWQAKKSSIKKASNLLSFPHFVLRSSRVAFPEPEADIDSFADVINDPSDVRVNRYAKSLFVAVWNQDLEEVLDCLNSNVCYRELEHYSVRLLCEAARRKNVDIVYALLHRGCSANEKLFPDLQYSTMPLHAAVEGGVEMTLTFLHLGAAINAKNMSGETPLYLATRNGNLEVVRVLLENGANADLCGSRSDTPLYVAVAKGYTEIAKLLIGKGADVNKANFDGKTPLYLADELSRTEIAQMLREANAIKENNIVYREYSTEGLVDKKPYFFGQNLFFLKGAKKSMF